MATKTGMYLLLRDLAAAQAKRAEAQEHSQLQTKALGNRIRDGRRTHGPFDYLLRNLVSAQKKRLEAQEHSQLQAKAQGDRIRDERRAHSPFDYQTAWEETRQELRDALAEVQRLAAAAEATEALALKGQAEAAFKAGYYCVWVRKEQRYDFHSLKLGDPDGAFAAWLSSRADHR